jgi:hypothetical protein
MQSYALIPPGYILAKDVQPGRRYGIAIPTSGLVVPLSDTEFETVTVDGEAIPCDCPGRFFSDAIHVKVSGEGKPRCLWGGQLLRVE